MSTNACANKATKPTLGHAKNRAFKNSSLTSCNKPACFRYAVRPKRVGHLLSKRHIGTKVLPPCMYLHLCSNPPASPQGHRRRNCGGRAVAGVVPASVAGEAGVLPALFRSVLRRLAKLVLGKSVFLALLAVLPVTFTFPFGELCPTRTHVSSVRSSIT